MTDSRDNSSERIREKAAQMVFEIMENGAFANLLLDKRLRQYDLSTANRRFLTETVNGSVRMVKHLDWVLNLFLKVKIERQNPWLRAILRVSAYQLIFMERIPDYAIVNDAVEAVRRKTGPGLAGVANGVLRNLIRSRGQFQYPEERVEYLAVFYSHPRWMVENFIEAYGFEHAQEMMAFNNCPPAVVLRCNELLSTVPELREMLERDGIESHVSPNYPQALIIDSLSTSLTLTLTFQEGRFYIQNEASMLAARILSPKPGRRIYDLCCGVGGKTTHLAELMNNEGEIYAFDLFEQKLKLLQDNCKRMGITMIKGRQVDATGLESARLPVGEAVLLDAPCSGMGVLARRADARWRKSPGDLSELPVLQSTMMEQAALLVAPGGKLLYSTCTINPGENQAVVSEFLNRHGEFVLDGFLPLIDFWPLDARDAEDAKGGMLCLLPGKYKTDGMFFALMRRMN